MVQESAILAFDKANTIIDISDQETFQLIDGFGFALTGGSAQHFKSMNASARAKLLQELFGNKKMS